MVTVTVTRGFPSDCPMDCPQTKISHPQKTLIFRHFPHFCYFHEFFSCRSVIYKKQSIFAIFSFSAGFTNGHPFGLSNGMSADYPMDKSVLKCQKTLIFRHFTAFPLFSEISNGISEDCPQIVQGLSADCPENIIFQKTYSSRGQKINCALSSTKSFLPT